MTGVTESMISAFAPERIEGFNVLDIESQWFACVDPLGFPYATPDDVGVIAADLIQRPDKERAKLAGAHPLELFTVLAWASNGLDESDRADIYASFPGLSETLDAARNRFGMDALLKACAFDPANPTDQMIAALRPENIATSIHPERWKRAVAVIGTPDLKPEQAGAAVYQITQTLSLSERAALVRNHTAEIWTLLDIATLPYPASRESVAEKFPGITEAFNAAVNRYGVSAMWQASVVTWH